MFISLQRVTIYIEPKRGSMPRKHCTRYILGEAEAALFLPQGRTLSELAQVRLMPDEVEALRLADQLGMYHENAAARMQISRATFSRIVSSARAKVADALVNGKAIRIVPLALAHHVLENTMSQHAPSDNAPAGTTTIRMDGTICIPIAVDHGLDSKLIPHFGSAPLYAIVDVVSRTMRTLDNGCTPVHGGCAPVEALAAQRVGAVIVGGIGTGAIRRLASHGIRVLKGHPGPISSLLDAYEDGALTAWDVEDGCQGHSHAHGHEHGL